MSVPPRHHPARPGPGYRTGSVADPHIRVSDAERDEVTERLSRHYADGRLDQGEFTLRLGRATAALTRHDLDGLFADLPRLADEPAPPRDRRRRLLPLLLLVMVVGLAVGSVGPLVQIPWPLLAVVGLLCWHRWRRRHAVSDRGR